MVREPGDHSSNISTPLSPPVAAQVKEMYDRLSHKDLLGRCRQGVTQNTNECLDSKIWAKCPKTGFVGLQRVLFSTCCAVGEFNNGGLATVEELYGAMGLATAQRLITSAEK